MSSRAYCARIWSCEFGWKSKRRGGIEERGFWRADSRELEEEFTRRSNMVNQLGTFIVGFGKLAPKLDSKAGSYFP